MKAAKPNNYIAKNWVDVNLALMKAFMGCRVTMEMLIQEDRYEQYWRVKDLGFQMSYPRTVSLVYGQCYTA